MIKDITLGQYYSTDSVIHRLDPRTKILAVILYLVELFLVKNYFGFILCGALLVLVIALSRVPLSFMLRGLRPIFIILMFTFALNLFMVPGEVIWSWWKLKITDQGLKTAVFMAIRLVLLILGSSLLTLTTKPISLTDGIERLFSPFRKILPTHEIAMMMSIALRFIPTLLDETNKIMKAQQARGADFESGNLIKRVKALVPILVPLFISAFRIAQDLALAMEARGYHGGEGRTRMHEMKYKGRDFMSFAVLLLSLAGVILLNMYM